MSSRQRRRLLARGATTVTSRCSGTVPVGRGSRVLAASMLAGTSLLGSIALAGPAAAAAIEVTSTADSGSGSLREAIEEANGTTAADTITFATGVTGSIDLLTQLPTITEPVTIAGPGAGVLTIGTTAGVRLLEVSSAYSPIAVEISGLTFSGGGVGGSSVDGAAIASEGSDLTLDAVTLSGNDGGTGGALFVEYGTLTITASTITGNTATGKGGALYADEAEVAITGSTVSDNDAQDHGGALYLDHGSLAMTTTTVADNDTQGRGGALAVYYNDAVVLDDLTISGNTAVEDGGAVWARYQKGFELHDSQVDDNTASAGGGLYLTYRVSGSADPLLDGNDLVDNHAGTGGAVYFDDMGQVDILNGTMSDNIADGDGGALWAYNTTALIDTASISDNTATGGQGGGVWAHRSALTFLDSTISGNTAPSSSAMYTYNGTDITMANSTVAGNTGAGPVLYAGDASPVLDFDHVTFAGNAGSAGLEGDSTTAMSFTHSIVYGTQGGDDLVSAGATTSNYSMFGVTSAVTDGVGDNTVGTDPQLGTLRDNGGPTETMVPLAGSPAVDAGDPTYNATTTAQRGEARTAIPTGSGAAITDIGAVEVFAPTATDDGSALEPVALPSAGGAVDVLGNDTGGGLTVSISTPPAHGTVTVSPEGIVTYTPDAGYSGPDSFEYTITDGSGYTSSAMAYVDIAAEPETPDPDPTDPDATDGTDSTGSGSGDGSTGTTTGVTATGLASTGADTSLLLPAGGGLLAAGGLLTLLGLRRRRPGVVDPNPTA